MPTGIAQQMVHGLPYPQCKLSKIGKKGCINDAIPFWII
jgi:hypothetical protein